MEQFPDDYECDGQIDIWEWMEEKEHIEDGGEKNVCKSNSVE